MLFSVIFPAYNAASYMPEAIESVLCQSYPDYEVIVIDDGSTDQSGAIADAFAALNESVQVVHQANMGPLLARRRGLREAHGKYIVFLDADDRLRADALEQIAAVIDATDADVVSFAYGQYATFAYSDISALQMGLYSGPDYQMVLDHVCCGLFNSLWGKAIRFCPIDLDAAYGAYAGLMHGEDLFQLLPILSCAQSLVRLYEGSFYYWVNPSSSALHPRFSQLGDIVIVKGRLVEYAQQQNESRLKRVAIGDSGLYISQLKVGELSDAGSKDKVGACVLVITG